MRTGEAREWLRKRGLERGSGLSSESILVGVQRERERVFGRSSEGRSRRCDRSKRTCHSAVSETPFHFFRTSPLFPSSFLHPPSAPALHTSRHPRTIIFYINHFNEYRKQKTKKTARFRERIRPLYSFLSRRIDQHSGTVCRSPWRPGTNAVRARSRF